MKPIIFSSHFIPLILDGRKTQTRWPIRPQPINTWGNYWEWQLKNKTLPFHKGMVAEKLGQIGDKRWIQETWGTNSTYSNTKPSELPETICIFYKSDYKEYEAITFHAWRRSIHMPKWASRITLEITGIRVERLQNISTQDIVAEGICPDTSFLGSANRYRHPFIELWNEINAKKGYGWDTNPWIGVFEFYLLDESKGG